MDRSWKRNVAAAAFFLGSAVWLGTTVARYVVGFDPYIPGTLEFKPAYSQELRLHSVWLYTMLGAWTGFSFFVGAAGGLWLSIQLRALFKTRGWLLMVTILLLLMIPAQIMISLDDYFLYTFFDGATGVPLASTSEILYAFASRMQSIPLNIAMALTLMCGFTIAVLGAFRPLSTTHASATQ
jgi:hypothetical protein